MRKTSTLVAIGFVAFTVLLVTATAFAQTSSSKLQGVWKVVETEAGGPNPVTNSNPQPGLYIFTAKYYSIMVVTADAPRPNVPADVTKATTQELLAAWNPFIANSGTYEIKGNELSVRPIVAKNPQVMSGSTFRVYSFKFEGDALLLTPIRDGTGSVADGGSIKLLRLE